MAANEAPTRGAGRRPGGGEAHRRAAAKWAGNLFSTKNHQVLPAVGGGPIPGPPHTFPPVDDDAGCDGASPHTFPPDPPAGCGVGPVAIWPDGPLAIPPGVDGPVAIRPLPSSGTDFGGRAATSS